MELEVIKKLIEKYQAGHSEFIKNADEAERYYKNETKILFDFPGGREETEDKPLRNANNRIPRNFHGLIVNQKASYMFTAPPLFDIGNTGHNNIVSEVLGDSYRKTCMQLCINAANTTIGWLHYWIDASGEFQYSVVDSKQIIPIWSKSLKCELIGVMRVYEEIDEESGDTYTIYEYWNESSCHAFRKKTGDSIDKGICYNNMFENPETGEMTAEYNHEYGEVPFIPFFNNNIHTNDLKNIKPLIDVYDKVYSGFINDLDDIQELIFIISGYGGTDLEEFLRDLKRYKTIKLDGDADHSGVSTLNIEIPIEARNSILDTTRKAIFEQGQGFDPRPENFGNQSGEALKFMYSLLEMKAGLTETEFQSGFSRLVRAVCRHKKIPCRKITQTWTRTCIRNDTEQAQICRDSVGIVSRRTILKNHPFVEDADLELEQLKKEEDENRRAEGVYADTFNNPGSKEHNDDSTQSE